MESQQQQRTSNTMECTTANVRGGQEHVCVCTYHSVGCPSGMVFMGASTTAVDMLALGGFFCGEKREQDVVELVIFYVNNLCYTNKKEFGTLDFFFTSGRCIFWNIGNATNRDTLNAAYTRCAPVT